MNYRLCPWPPGVAPGSLAVLLGSIVMPAPFTPMVATAQEDSSRAEKRALPPSPGNCWNNL